MTYLSINFQYPLTEMFQKFLISTYYKAQKSKSLIILCNVIFSTALIPEAKVFFRVLWTSDKYTPHVHTSFFLFKKRRRNLLKRFPFSVLFYRRGGGRSLAMRFLKQFPDQSNLDDLLNFSLKVVLKYNYYLFKKYVCIQGYSSLLKLSNEYRIFKK